MRGAVSGPVCAYLDIVHAKIDETKRVMKERCGMPVHTCKHCGIPYLELPLPNVNICYSCEAVIACGRHFCTADNSIVMCIHCMQRFEIYGP